jgi:hypothetical protein
MNEKAISLFLFGWVMGWLFITVIFNLTHTRPADINQKWRTEAISKGYGEWIVVNPTTGETEFKWKEK